MKFNKTKIINIDENSGNMIKNPQDENKAKFIENFTKEMRIKGFDNYDDWLYITRRIRENLNVKTKKRKKKLPVFLTKREISLLLDQTIQIQIKKSKRKDTPKIGLIVETMLKTGLRNEELCNLRIENIDFDEGIFKVVNGKGGKDRMGIISPSLINKLRLHCGIRTNGYVFLSNRGNLYSTRQIQHMVKEIKELCNIQKEFTAHTFRHTFATILIQEGIGIREIQKLLGHENIETTTIYTQIDLEMLKNPIKEIMDKVGE